MRAIDNVDEKEAEAEAQEERNYLIALGLRTVVIDAYEIPRIFYKTVGGLSPVKQMEHLGVAIWWGVKVRGRMGATRRKLMDVDKLVENWRKVIVGLAVAHDRDEADRYEAAVEDLLTPILAAPIKQVREFYPKLLAALKADPQVPYLVWRSYEIWVDQVISKAGDGEIKELKTDLAKEITAMVEQDVKDQLPEALVRALQWRSAEKLAEVKEVVTREKAAGRGVKLKGRESCLFMYAGAVDEMTGEPEVCIQI